MASTSSSAMPHSPQSSSVIIFAPKPARRVSFNHLIARASTPAGIVRPGTTSYAVAPSSRNALPPAAAPPAPRARQSHDAANKIPESGQARPSAFAQSGHYSLQSNLPMIETRWIGSNCANVGFCRIKGAEQCKQHKKRSACQRSYAASAGASHDSRDDKLSRQRARPLRNTNSPEHVLTTSRAARSFSVNRCCCQNGATLAAHVSSANQCQDRPQPIGQAPPAEALAHLG